MQYRFLQPSPFLQPYIDYYLVMDNTGCIKAPDSTAEIKVYPAPHAQMAFNYGDTSYERLWCGQKNPSPDCSVSGYFTTPAAYYPGKKLGVIMVGFKPLGIKAFVPFDIGELNNVNQPLDDIYNNRIRLLYEQLNETTAPDERIRMLERFLFSIFRPVKQDDLIANAIQYINQSGGIVAVSSLAKHYTYSQKHFERRFQNATGIMPKLFCRIVRFQKIFKYLEKKDLRMVEKAIESGFYDQAHFIKEFKQFTGVSPKEHLRSIRRSDIGKYFDEMTKDNELYNIVYE